MKSAVIAAIVAALIASSVGYAAAPRINGHSIQPHSIPLNRLASSPGTTQFFYVSGPQQLVPVQTAATLEATCPTGTKVISGGYYAAGAMVEHSSYWFLNREGWTTRVENDSALPATASGYAICATAPNPILSRPRP